jgi:hypothetical protein
MASQLTIRKISKAIAFWYMTEARDITKSVAHPVTSEALKQKYASLKTKIKDGKGGSAASLSDDGSI